MLPLFTLTQLMPMLFALIDASDPARLYATSSILAVIFYTVPWIQAHADTQNALPQLDPVCVNRMFG